MPQFLQVFQKKNEKNLAHITLAHLKLLLKPNSQYLQVEVYDEDCIVSDDIRINFGDPNDSSFELTATCDGATSYSLNNIIINR